jgi:hypothetical protein
MAEQSLTARGPFRGHVGRALAALAFGWGTRYRIRARDGVWYAERPGRELAGDTPDALVRAMLADRIAPSPPQHR